MLGPVRILCAVRDRQSLQPLLADMDDGIICIFDVVTTGRQTLEACRKAPPDILVIDAVLPEMDGLETTRRIRSLPSRKKAEIPIVALTSNVSEIDRKAALEAGMNAFTEKPVLVDRLFETIRQYMIKG